MEMLIFFSLLGIASTAGILEIIHADPEGTDPEDTELEATETEDTESEGTETDAFDLTAPDAQTLDGDVNYITDAVGQIDHSNRTEDEEYLVTDNLYDISLGSGDDTVVVENDNGGYAELGDGDDTVWGGDGRDIIRGDEGDDSIYGGAGSDNLIDTEGENIIYGEDGDDFIRASNGSTVIGGDGADTFSLYLSTNADSPLQVLDFDPDVDQLQNVRLFVSDGDSYDLTAVAREDGTGTDLMFDGHVLAEIYGASVDDLTDVPVTIDVNGGTYTDDDTGHLIVNDYDLPETIFGGGGDDRISAGPGDQVDGGDGNDVISAHGQFSLGAQDPVDMSTVNGGAGDDIILSTNGNVLTGGEGADIFGLSLSQYGISSAGGVSYDLTESVITDFDPDEDVIYIEYGFLKVATGSDGDVADALSIQVWENGEGADILAGDEVIARVTGGQSLRVEDLMISRNGLEADILGDH